MTSVLLKSMVYAIALQKTKKKKKMVMKPKKSSLLKLTICRICKEQNGEIPIFNNFLQPNIPEEIHYFSGITINKLDDNLSKEMCKNCLDLLNGCIKFREICQMNNKTLKEVFIKEEYNNFEESNPHLGIDESYNSPSPIFSDNSDIWDKWECSLCNKPFSYLEAYNDHIVKCPKNSKITDHQKSSGDVTKKRFLCEICGKTAHSNANLVLHKGTHENNFPFKCESCPYKGRTINLLKVHKRSHMVEKPFKCWQCNKSTTTASNLARHMRHIHSSNRLYKCTYCDKAFKYQYDMKTHIKVIHLKEDTVQCDVCKKMFNSKNKLYKHIWKLHKIKGIRQ